MTILRANAKIGRELADGAEAIAISERAKQQICSQATKSKAKLQGPNFFETGFSDGTTPPAISNGVNVATTHWKL